jgi:hypothetical protein
VVLQGLFEKSECRTWFLCGEIVVNRVLNVVFGCYFSTREKHATFRKFIF